MNNKHNRERPDFQAVEAKWQKRWEEAGIFGAREDSKKKKMYVLEMFPYPSASGLHMGHIRNYSMGDAYARFRRMQGFNVLYPMGYDAFGLPAENAAIKNKTHPLEYTESSIAGIRSNQKSLGLSYDWSRELATCYPDYYRWNQWFFIQMMKKGLAYKKEAPVNWCEKCNTVLANEQVEGGKCWRCGSEVVIKNLKQWFLKITDYADELLKGLDRLEWPDSIKAMQRNWIGRSEGTLIDFPVMEKNGSRSKERIQVFTTRPDTLYGVTFLLYAPEHPFVEELVKGTENEAKVKEFTKKVILQDRFERTAEDREKEGIFTGRYCINPANNDKIPIYLANFVLPDYGTGAVMAVPAHDQRDFEFAKKFKLPIKVVIKPHSFDLDADTMSRAYMDQGTLVNSQQFDGSQNYDAIDEITDFLKEKGYGKKVVQYKLRDWGISRQRYWGTPIPVVYCDKCGIVPVDEKDLPVLLPTDVRFTGKGNPLASNDKFVKTKCPKCGGHGRRETDTMDTFVDSSWYFLRFCSPDKKGRAFNTKSVGYWMPVDQYIGGAEHAVMHLLYARFFTKVIRDLGLVKFDEPFLRLFNQGIVYKDGHKMSKSFGNVVTQEEIARRYGIDTARLFLLFVAAPDSQLEWSDEGIVGSHKFLMKVRSLASGPPSKPRQGRLETRDRQIMSKLHALIKEVTANMETIAYNKAIGDMMKFTNSLIRYSEDSHGKVMKDCIDGLLVMLSPFAPHTCEELWEGMGRNPDGKHFISTEKWPVANEKLIDKKLEMMEDLVRQTEEDITQIIKLVGKKPEKINVFVSPEWKYKAYGIIAGTKDRKGIVGELMKEPAIRKEGKAAAKFAERLGKQARLEDILPRTDEIITLEESRKEFERLFSCKVNIVTDGKGSSEKSRRAEPGKPGIEVV